MRKLILVTMFAAFAVACNNDQKANEQEHKTSESVTQVEQEENQSYVDSQKKSDEGKKAALDSGHSNHHEPASAPQNSWKINSNYSIQFSNSDVSGAFKKFSGTIKFDETDLAGSRFDVTIDVNSINTGNGLMNKHAKGADWFDAAKYPSIKFNSAKIEKSGSQYLVTGQLEIKDVKKEISFPFTFAKSGNGGTFNAKFTINKNDYNVGKKGDDVGETLQMEISVPVTK